MTVTEGKLKVAVALGPGVSVMVGVRVKVGVRLGSRVSLGRGVRVLVLVSEGRMTCRVAEGALGGMGVGCGRAAPGRLQASARTVRQNKINKGFLILLFYRGKWILPPPIRFRMWS